MLGQHIFIRKSGEKANIWYDDQIFDPEVEPKYGDLILNRKNHKYGVRVWATEAIHDCPKCMRGLGQIGTFCSTILTEVIDDEDDIKINEDVSIHLENPIEFYSDAFNDSRLPTELSYVWMNLGVYEKLAPEDIVQHIKKNGGGILEWSLIGGFETNLEVEYGEKQITDN